MTAQLTRYISLLSAQPELLKGIQHGIEKESLRISPDGKLSQESHPSGLGSALTNSLVTTDFAESLVEFITPVSDNIDETLGQLADLHRFAYQQMGSELLWPLSMPCFVGGEADIRIAEYGDSNIGKMKTLYRKGLHHRYGSVMQVIAGVHFNFSLPAHFWQQWHQWQAGAESLQQSQSAGYLAMLRNYRRLGWLVPYLFGASPALCGSFLQQKNSALPFEKMGQGTYYLPYATSLRMSDLGYTNRAQARLQVDYNSLTGYLASVDRALHTPEPRFAKIGVKVDGEYRQLNSNLLQIENELYAPIRPKRVAESGEKPSEALARGGIEYIEVRALDVSPFHQTGVSADEIRFLDVLLVYCLLQESPVLDCDGLSEAARNITTTVLYGRDPNAQVEVSGQLVGLKVRAMQLLSEMRAVAEVMDKAAGGYDYQAALAKQLAKVEDPDLTPSARLLNEMQQRSMDNGCLGMHYAESHKAELLAQQGSNFYSDDALHKVAQLSVEAQKEIESESSVEFEQFLADYFA
ncbi:glutamate--cysteine ligase [Corallincola spongiicola]|uniref:glutamate--cysteine ligase n=1 Tax=Corallincola spongiicola TaxID=2520508 RepID=UPI001A93664E|nr:glutamate--cysteine ligase [Corallincola spongiicola]